jgi:hypothetical protein
MLRLFIFEPLESFDTHVESDLDVLNIRRFRYGVKRNKLGVARLGAMTPPIEWTRE